jgi:hypothetical protein
MWFTLHTPHNGSLARNLIADGANNGGSMLYYGGRIAHDWHDNCCKAGLHKWVGGFEEYNFISSSSI